MKKLAQTLLLLALVAVIAAPVAAADDEKKAKKKKRQAKAPAVAFLKNIDLTEEQKKQVAAIQKEFAPKLQAVRAKSGLTNEQRQAQRAASKKAREEGKKGKELRQAVAAAVKLTDDQKAAAAGAQKEARKIQGELKAAVLAVLTDEQKAKLPKKGAGGNKKKKKKDAA